MPPSHPARTTRAVIAGLSVAAALGIVAALSDDADGAGASQPASLPASVEVVVPDGVDDEAVRDAVREWLDHGGDPPPAPEVLDAPDDPITTSAGS